MTFKAKVVDYIPDIAHKWDFIGIKLGQSNPVKLLRNSERDDERKLSEILHKWIDSDKFPKTEEKAWRLFCGVLKGPGVQLGSVAREIEKAQLNPANIQPTRNPPQIPKSMMDVERDNRPDDTSLDCDDEVGLVESIGQRSIRLEHLLPQIIGSIGRVEIGGGSTSGDGTGVLIQMGEEGPTFLLLLCHVVFSVEWKDEWKKKKEAKNVKFSEANVKDIIKKAIEICTKEESIIIPFKLPCLDFKIDVRNKIQLKSFVTDIVFLQEPELLAIQCYRDKLPPELVPFKIDISLYKDLKMKGHFIRILHLPSEGEQHINNYLEESIGSVTEVVEINNLMKYKCDTYHGSSGSPVVTIQCKKVKKGEIPGLGYPVLLGVHKGNDKKGKANINIGVSLSKEFLEEISSYQSCIC